MQKPSIAGIVLLLAALLSGCGSGEREQPAFADLYSVKGVVKRDGKLVKGGAVMFFPDPDKNEFLINSEVGGDGSFSLTTVRTTDRSGERRPGAPAGQYKVNYVPPMGDQLAGGQGTPIELPASVVVEAKDNSLELIVPRK